MYDTTSRSIKLRTTTSENVGPNTYVLCNPRSEKKNCAPFLSSAPKYLPDPKRGADTLYDINYYRPKIKGGSVLTNKAKRFVYKTSDIPPPTRYNPRPIQCRKKKLKCDLNKPKLYLCRIPYSITVTAPSIPTKVDENGYELDDDGNLIKEPPDEESPEEVDIPTTIGKGMGCRWSCRTSERFNGRQYESCGPGPAAYTVQVPKCRRAEEDELYREMARRFSFVPRFLEAQELRAVKEKQPGPGSYDIVAGKWEKKRSKSIRPAPFIRRAARFPKEESDTPPPTKYNVCDCSRNRKQFSTKCVGFGAEAARFEKKRVESMPGPGSYEIKGALVEKVEKKKNPHALFEPPFNTTSIRDFNYGPKDAAYMPSSADYPEDKEEEEDDEQQYIFSSVFKSMVCRFYSPSEKKDYIGPAKYNVDESFHKNRDRKSFNIAKLAFNVTGLRSTTPQVKRGVPCPTTYNAKIMRDSRGSRFAFSPRWRCEEQTPGPGQYNVHPRYEHSTYTSVDTHNLRLKENILRKKLRMAPQETRDRWLATMKKRKLLKWFNVAMSYEERMMILVSQLFDKPL